MKETYKTETPCQKDFAYNGKQKDLLYEIANSNTNLSKASNLESSIAGCSCPPCGCEQSVWTLILSPGGIGAAGGIFVGFSPIS